MVSSTIGSSNSPPATLPGFDTISRYWDPIHKIFAAKLLPGEFYVTREQEMIVTVLGSCISACIRDPETGVGGMNHFMLPVSQNESHGTWGGENDKDYTMRYGDFAMKRLVSEILKHGGRRENLEVKIIGGGRILEQMTDVGGRNIDFAHKFVRETGLKLANEDTGGIYPRKVYYFPQDGKVRVKKLRTLHNNTIVERETEYMHELAMTAAKIADHGKPGK
jgi:chemotaxis protein CheD